MPSKKKGGKSGNAEKSKLNKNGDEKKSSTTKSGATSSSLPSTMTETEAKIIEMLRAQSMGGGAGSSSNTDGEGGSSDPQKKVDAAAAQHLLAASSSGKKRHTFWDTQPMSTSSTDGNLLLSASPSTSLSSPSTVVGTSTSNHHSAIVPNKPVSELRQEPYNMPRGFEWCDVDVLDTTQCSEVYELLSKNYVEDDDCMFRFDYSPDFLRWALTPPHFRKEFHLGVRSSKNGKLVALITGVPATVRAHQSEMSMVEINFLCVHKRLRSKRLAPVLIKEITRRVNHSGVFQAVYTAGVTLPVPVASCRYHHRSLDPRKLVDVKFSQVPPRMTLARMHKLNKLPTTVSTPGLRPMTREDVPSARKLLQEYHARFKLCVHFTDDEFAHWILPREGVIDTYVACNGGGKDDNEAQNDDTPALKEEVTDMISFYHLPSAILGHPRHTHLRAAYSFYNVATSVPLVDLMRDALILAKGKGSDVFNALDQMENSSFLSELKFGIGDGTLKYYLYNWNCPTMENKDVGIVLL